MIVWILWDSTPAAGGGKKIPEESSQLFNEVWLAMTGLKALVSEPALLLLCPLQIPEVGSTG